MLTLANLLRLQSRRVGAPLATRATATFPCNVANSPSPLTRSSSPCNPTRSLTQFSRYFSTSRTWRDIDTKKKSQAPEISKTLYIGNLPYEATPTDIKELLKPYGQIETVRMRSDEQGKNLGYAHVDFHTEEDAALVRKSAEEEPFWLINRTLFIQFSNGPGRAKAQRGPSNKLFFNEFDGTTNDLREILSKYRMSIIQINFLKERETDNLMNKGHIIFKDEESATSVLKEMNGFVSDSGLKLHLEYSNPTPQWPKRNSVGRSHKAQR